MIAILALSALFASFGLLLGFTATRLKPDDGALIEAIDNLLPQTQCGQCNYPGCRPYANAIATGDADINQCPPGGEDGILALAELLGLEPKPLNSEHGEYKSKAIAVVIEKDCIGCAKCIPACPVDAILGAPQHMHTVIESECTGCELCIEPCPVDCIVMKPADKKTDSLSTKSVNETIANHPPSPCIRCGDCAQICPVDLLPQQIYWFSQTKELEKARALHLFDCIECGLCDTICPSHIPLVQSFRAAKSEIVGQDKETRKAGIAKRRHQARLTRLENERSERARQKQAALARIKETVRNRAEKH